VDSINAREAIAIRTAPAPRPGRRASRSGTDRRSGMAEADTTLKQKTSELETCIHETRSELSRVDEAQRKDVHRELVAICKEAADWLEQCVNAPEPSSSDDAAALTQRAEGYLRDLRMRRHAI
jgi:hypothetical protein